MTFYFYDLETSGINSRKDRIMQFGGQPGRQSGAAGWASEAEQAASQAYNTAGRPPSGDGMWERDAIKSWPSWLRRPPRCAG